MAACALLGSPNTTERFFSRLGQEREERERLGWVLCEGAVGCGVGVRGGGGALGSPTHCPKNNLNSHIKS